VEQRTYLHEPETQVLPESTARHVDSKVSESALKSSRGHQPLRLEAQQVWQWPTTPSRSAPPDPTVRFPWPPRPRAACRLPWTRPGTLLSSTVGYSRHPHNDGTRALRCCGPLRVAVALACAACPSVTWRPFSCVSGWRRPPCDKKMLSCRRLALPRHPPRSGSRCSTVGCVRIDWSRPLDSHTFP